MQANDGQHLRVLSSARERYEGRATASPLLSHARQPHIGHDHMKFEALRPTPASIQLYGLF